jgi:hypothetical protein
MEQQDMGIRMCEGGIVVLQSLMGLEPEQDKTHPLFEFLNAPRNPGSNQPRPSARESVAAETGPSRSSRSITDGAQAAQAQASSKSATEPAASRTSVTAQASTGPNAPAITSSGGMGK